MKKILILILICGAVYFVGKNQGWFNRSHSEAVSTYQEFMDSWIVRDYSRAQLYTIGDATEIVREAEFKTNMEFIGVTVKTPLGYRGVIEKSRIKVLSETQSGNRIHLEVLYSASISWPGSTANPMSPGSWTRYNQKATMEQVGSVWKVASFSSDGEV